MAPATLAAPGVRESIHTGLPAPDDDLGAGDVGAAFRSLVLPGWGQLARDRRWGWVFPVVEAGAWVGVAHWKGQGRRHRDRFRDTAWTYARTNVWSGPRSEGPWEYYERMGRWDTSGRFDLTPDSPALAPETDPSTYNGQVWRLAQEIYLPGGAGSDPDPQAPGFEQALAYYSARAVPPSLAWDWRGDVEVRSRFLAEIDRSDDAYRTATTFVGVALANRFASAVEAFVAGHRGTDGPGRARLRARAVSGPEPGSWELRVLVRTPEGGGPR